MKFRRQFLLFCLVGSIGFVVDSVVLYLCKGLVGLYFGRLFSFSFSVFVTWILNRNMTFADRVSGKSMGQEFAHYWLLMLLGGVVNFCTYAILISHFAFLYEQPVWAIAAGSIAGMGVNLLSSKYLLYRYQCP